MTSYNLASLPNPGRTSAPASAGIIIGAGGITPTGTISITDNGTYDVTQYASADVNVSGGGGQSRDIVLSVEGEGTAYACYVTAPTTEITSAKAGDCVFVVTSPGAGYVLDGAQGSSPALPAQAVAGLPMGVDYQSKVIYFTMPDGDVSITVYFDQMG